MSDKIRENIREILKRYWKHDSFRPLQEEIILSVLAKNDTLALLPTGGGKSLCFQIPGLVLGGTTLVISPLIALMNDQVNQLRKKGISAIAISSSMTFKEIDIALNNAALGHVQFLYISPERLQNEDFKAKLAYLPINLIAVDEAHCISQWGYDFRPSFLHIKDLRLIFDKIPIIALTASATKEVKEDIQVKLEFKNQQIFHSSFERKNLRYVVQVEENKFERLVKLIQNVGGSGIVYARNRRNCEETAKFLKQNKFSAEAYHAGMNYLNRSKIQEDWASDKIQIICATNAFGMGVDKANVRFVVHLDLPDSLEAYFQEAGRAGRDGLTAYAVIFCTEADRVKLVDRYLLNFPEIEQIKQAYSAICNYYQIAVNSGEGVSVDFDIEKICASYNLQALTVYNSIKFLEKENYVSLFEAGFEPSKVHILVNKETLYEFELRFPKHEYLIKTLLRSYGGLFENYVHISENLLAQRIKSSSQLVSSQLKLLHDNKLLAYIPQAKMPKLIFTRNRINANHLQFDPKNYELLKQLYLKRIEDVIAYSKNDKICRQSQLLMYFNEFDNHNCGHCDVCLALKPKDLGKAKEKIKSLLALKRQNLSDLKQGMLIYNHDTWIMALNELIDDNIVGEGENGYFLK
ncbi:MAG: RecQ family ATP-dependent DNA helicase [Sphingobacteriaceae bacterium]|nr:RecQ family ATP-dependent DNA helicase [Sphingobacteriaceae bacterium]